MTVEQYLAALPPERREAMAAVRAVIRKNLPPGYEEGLQYGAIGYYVPHALYPAGYHCDPSQPLPFLSLASRKNYMTLHMACIYGDSEVAQGFRAAWAETGKKLDAGKGCVRFKSLDDLVLPVIGATIKRFPVARLIAMFDAARTRTPMKRAEIAARTKAKKQTDARTKAHKQRKDKS